MILELYQPHAKQLEFHQSKARYRVAAWGRQSGKSTACINDLLFKAWENPGHKYWFVSPTFAQAREQYRRCVGMLADVWQICAKKNQTELRIKLINQSELRFISGEVEQNLRGATLNGVVIDEVREQPPNLWGMVLRPMLATTHGWAAFVSTPNGFDAFYDLAETARVDTTGEWALFQAPSTANPLFSYSEFEAARREMSEPVFAQEILAEFRDITRGKAYVNHGAHNQSLVSPFSTEGGLTSPHLPILVSCDFNVNPIAWELGQHRGKEFYYFDEIYIEGSHTAEASKVLIERVKHHAPGVIIIGDATGNATKTSSAGQSDYGILCSALSEARIKWQNLTPAANPNIKDRVNAMNTALRAADGTVNFKYNPTTCPHLKRDLERVAWKAGSTGAVLDQKTDPTLTHASDGVGYSVYELSDKWQPSPGRLRVIVR